MAIPHVFQWNQGAPEKLQAGMLVHLISGSVFLIGDIGDDAFIDNSHADEVIARTARWCWAIKPSELDWAISMANRR